jgi:ankyrin repeat protein
MKRVLVPATTLFVLFFVGLSAVAQEVDERSPARAALFDAIEAGDKNEVLKILTKRHHVNLNHREFGDGQTFLIEAIRADQPEIVDILLKHGANPHLREIPAVDEEEEKTEGDTPLAAALALEEDWDKMVLLLIRHGLNLSQQPAALHSSNSLETLQFLLDHGAPINGRDTHGATYLEALVSRGDDRDDVEEELQLLLQRGANVNIPDNDGATPLLRCGSVAIAELLIAHGANVSAADRRGMTLLHFAASADGPRELGELMITECADVNARNNDGYTPLDLLIIGEFDYDFALLLVAHSASVNEVLVQQHGLADQFEDIRRTIASGEIPPVGSRQWAVSSEGIRKLKTEN